MNVIMNLCSAFVILMLFRKVHSSRGIFQININNYRLKSTLNATSCCNITKLQQYQHQQQPQQQHSIERKIIDNQPQPLNSQHLNVGNCVNYCRVFMEICLSVYQKNPYSFTCAIGEGEIVTELMGSAHIFPNSNRHYSLLVRERWQPNFNIRIKIMHSDPITNKSSQILMLSSAVESVSPSTNWVTRQLSTDKDQFEMSVSFRFMCAEYYYGKECDRHCQPSAGIKGHYNCSSDGHKICHHGYTGKYCDKVICNKKCIHGTCIGPNKCRCSTGWKGESCDNCIKYPGCVHGKCRRDQKTNQILPLTCECEKGWGGMFCNIDLNYCSNHENVCLNGGQCQNYGDVNTNQQYRCLCKRGYSGTHCEKKVANCTIRGCSNNGTCKIDEASKLPMCVCKNPFYGDECQFNQTSCAENPCLGINSKCIPDVNTGFRCRCAAGFAGRNCEVDLDECLADPCENSGMCIDQPSGYICVCPVGFFGDRCQVNKNDCQKLSCANGARCMDRANRIVCACKPGWSGPTCSQNINECNSAKSNPCQNNGECIDTPGSFRCKCPPNFSGTRCQSVSQKCLINPCLNNGYCFLQNNESNYQHLATVASSLPTNISASSSAVSIEKIVGGSFVCVCPSQYKGILCNQPVSPTFVDSTIIRTPANINPKSPFNEATLRICIISIILISIIAIILIVIIMYYKTYSKKQIPGYYKKNGDINSSFFGKRKWKANRHNTDIQVLNNKLSRSSGGLLANSTKSTNEQLPLSINKLNNQFSNSDVMIHNNNKSKNTNCNHLFRISQDNLICTYQCSERHHQFPSTIHSPNVYYQQCTNENKSNNNNPNHYHHYRHNNNNNNNNDDKQQQEQQQKNSVLPLHMQAKSNSSSSSILHKSAEPESLNLYSRSASSDNNEFKKMRFKSSLDSNLNTSSNIHPRDDSSLMLASNKILRSDKRDNYRNYGRSSSHSSLLDGSIKPSLRTSISQQQFTSGPLLPPQSPTLEECSTVISAASPTMISQKSILGAYQNLHIRNYSTQPHFHNHLQYQLPHHNNYSSGNTAAAPSSSTTVLIPSSRQIILPRSTTTTAAYNLVWSPASIPPSQQSSHHTFPNISCHQCTSAPTGLVEKQKQHHHYHHHHLHQVTNINFNHPMVSHTPAIQQQQQSTNKTNSESSDALFLHPYQSNSSLANNSVGGISSSVTTFNSRHCSTSSVPNPKLDYNLISNPNFRETSLFYNSNNKFFCHSIQSIDTDSTIIEDATNVSPTGGSKLSAVP